MPAQLLPLAYRMLGHTAGLVGVGGAVAVVDYTSKITLGSIISTILIIAIAGIFTVRSKIANIWREEAEGERAAKERCHEELQEERTNRADFDKQQQELRHDLKDEVVGLRSQLKVMEARTDLTVALDAIREMNETSVRAITGVVSDAFIEKSKQEHEETHRLLKEISDKLPSEPIEISLRGSTDPKP